MLSGIFFMRPKSLYLHYADISSFVSIPNNQQLFRKSMNKSMMSRLSVRIYLLFS